MMNSKTNDDLNLARQLEKHRAEAMNAGNAEKLSELIAEDALYIHSSGILDDRGHYLHGIASGANRYRSIALEVERVLMSSPSNLLVYGRMTGFVVKDSSEITLRSKYLAAWRRVNDSASGWQLFAFQATKEQ
jgi:hypothetical protein